MKQYLKHILAAIVIATVFNLIVTTMCVFVTWDLNTYNISEWERFARISFLFPYVFAILVVVAGHLPDDERESL